MENLIIGIILAAILFSSAYYVYKAKKSGAKCIGCPSGKSCSSCCGCHNKQQ